MKKMNTYNGGGGGKEIIEELDYFWWLEIEEKIYRQKVSFH